MGSSGRVDAWTGADHGTALGGRPVFPPRRALVRRRGAVWVTLPGDPGARESGTEAVRVDLPAQRARRRYSQVSTTATVSDTCPPTFHACRSSALPASERA